MKNMLIALLFTCWVLPLQATIVDNGAYTTINGLDWLDLTVTGGDTLPEALVANPGWVLATRAQYLDMISYFYTVSPDTVLGVTDPISFMSNAIGLVSDMLDTSSYMQNMFQVLFGVPSPSSGGHSQISQASYGYYQAVGSIGIGGVYAHDRYDVNDTDRIQFVLEEFDETNTAMTTNSRDRGMFFVRDEVSVPEPTVFSLICLGLLGFSISRRKYIKN